MSGRIRHFTREMVAIVLPGASLRGRVGGGKDVTGGGPGGVDQIGTERAVRIERFFTFRGRPLN